jgi:hypothetical protein
MEFSIKEHCKDLINDIQVQHGLLFNHISLNDGSDEIFRFFWFRDMLRFACNMINYKLYSDFNNKPPKIMGIHWFHLEEMKLK